MCPAARCRFSAVRPRSSACTTGSSGAGSFRRRRQQLRSPSWNASSSSLTADPPRSVHVMPNGVAIEEFEEADVSDFRRNHGLADAPFVLFMGRLNEIKGPDLLLEAFARIHRGMPRHHLVFAGPGRRDARVARAQRQCGRACPARAFRRISRRQRESVRLSRRGRGGRALPPGSDVDRRTGSRSLRQAGHPHRSLRLRSRAGARLRARGSGRGRRPCGCIAHPSFNRPKLAIAWARRCSRSCRQEYTWNAAALRYIEIFEAIRARAA